jgi:hypothetical protein
VFGVTAIYGCGDEGILPPVSRDRSDREHRREAIMEVHAIRRTPLHRRAAVAITALAMAACGGGGATGPEDGGRDYTLTIRLHSVLSTAICEEAFTHLDGGEFVWQVSVAWPDGTNDVLDATEGYPNPAAYRTMRVNQAKPIDKEITRTIHSIDGMSIWFRVLASEVDFDIFGGNPRRDARMDGQLGSVFILYDKFGWRQDDVTVRVQPVDECKFEAAFSIRATPLAEDPGA